MSVLNKEEFLSKIHERIGNDTSDEAIAFMEDMTDTYNSLATVASSNEAEMWKKKYEENDASWKQKYIHKFFHGGTVNYEPMNKPNEPEEDRTNITIDDLFEKE